MLKNTKYHNKAKSTKSLNYTINITKTYLSILVNSDIFLPQDLICRFCTRTTQR